MLTNRHMATTNVTKTMTVSRSLCDRSTT